MNFNNTNAFAARQNFTVGRHAYAVAQQAPFPVYYHGPQAPIMVGQVLFMSNVQGYLPPQGDGAIAPAQCTAAAAFGQDQTPRSTHRLVLIPLERNPWEEHSSGLRTPSISPRYSPSARQSFSGATSDHSRTSSEIGSPPPASATGSTELAPPEEAADPTHETGAIEAAAALAGAEAVVEAAAEDAEGVEVEAAEETLTEEEFETLLTHLDELDPKTRRSAVLQLSARGLVWRLASSGMGSRFVQEVLEERDEEGKPVPVPLRAGVAAGLRGHVNEAWTSLEAAPHANHVLQKIIEVLPASCCSFVVKELLAGSVERAACSKYGCRIVQRLIEKFPWRYVNPLVREILEPETTLKLMVSRFGNFVVQCILERGTEDQATYAAAAFYETDDAKFTRLCEHMYASHVVQKAMKHCRDEVRRSIIERITRIERVDPRFRRSVYGSFVAHEARRWLRAYGDALLLPRAQPRARRGGRGVHGLPQQRPRTAAAAPNQDNQEVPARRAPAAAAHGRRPVDANAAPGVWA